MSGTSLPPPTSQLTSSSLSPKVSMACPSSVFNFIKRPRARAGLSDVAAFTRWFLRRSPNSGWRSTTRCSNRRSNTAALSCHCASGNMLRMRDSASSVVVPPKERILVFLEERRVDSEQRAMSARTRKKCNKKMRQITRFWRTRCHAAWHLTSGATTPRVIPPRTLKTQIGRGA